MGLTLTAGYGATVQWPLDALVLLSLRLRNAVPPAAVLNCLGLSAGLRPKRTIRMVLWTAEEPGGVGASQYFERHKVSR